MQRVYNELKAAGFPADGPLKVEDCLPFDQMHYLGEEAMLEAGKVLKAGKGKKLMDLGSGFGGPARFMALTFECEVVGLELQKELVAGCTELSQRMEAQLQGRATFRQGCATDAASFAGLEGQVDGIYSMLTILHIPDRHLVWPLAFKALKPDGRMYHEDFFMKKPFTAEEEHLLADVVGTSLPLAAEAEYVKQLETAGFTDIEFSDMSEEWADFVAERHRKYEANRTRHVEVQGQALYDTMLQFYQAMDTLFAGGNLGGVRVTATKPASAIA